MKNRLFIALPLPDEIKSKIYNYSQNNLSGLKITKKENLHITLLFLGDTENSKIPEIGKLLEEACQNISSFNLEISRIGQFPPKGTPKIVFITGDEGREKLIRLANEIRTKLLKSGFSDDKPFKYHITIGRAKKYGNEFIKISQFNENLPFKADKVILYKSDLQSTDPVYEKLKTLSLKK